MATDERITSKADTPPAGDSQAAKTKMGHKMALVVYQRRSSLDNGSTRHVDDDDDSKSMIVRPESLEHGQEKGPGFPYKEGAKIARTRKTNTGVTYKRKRGRPAGSKSAKSMTEQKTPLFDSCSSSSTYSKSENDDDFEPPTPTSKRGRPECSKSAKRMMEQKRPFVHSSRNSSEGKEDSVKGTALDRAEEVKKKLPEESCFIKCMTHSQVVKGFWLGVPAEFSRNSLPKGDVYIVLEDEEGQTWRTTYIAYKTGLSGGWKDFAEQHDLKVGDALVFHLVEPTTFKVYILRENKFTTTDGALGLLSLDKSMEDKTAKKKEKESSDKRTKTKKVPRKKIKKVLEVVTGGRIKPSNNDSENLASKEAAAGSGIRSISPDTGDFVAVKSLENFKIVVGDNKVVGRVVLPDHLRMQYYELCLARKAFLHRHLPKQISPTLATGMIVETANIAEGIRALSATSLEDLPSWKKTLESFESLGMDVTSMIERINALIGLLSAPAWTMEELEGYEELKLARAHAAKQVGVLESRLLNLKNFVKEMDEMLEASAKKKKDRAVQKLATAPW